MKGYQSIPKVFLLVFTALLMVLTFNTTNAKAITKTQVLEAEKVMRNYDGISDWRLVDNVATNQYGSIPIGGNVSLGYAFGAARDANGNVKAGDKTITLESKYSFKGDIPNITNSKINIFLIDNGKYYGILHQGDDSYIGGKPENASISSIDFALLENSNTSAPFYDTMNLLTNASQIDSSYKTYKLFYTANDKNGRKVFKMVGYFNKKNVYFEIVLRPSPSGSPVVQRELYVYNAENTTAKFQTFYGEDTGLNPDNNDNSSVDNVPMFAIGGGLGLYIESGLKNSESKLFITNNIDGGFKDFMGRVLAYPDNWSQKGMQYGSSTPIKSPSLPVVMSNKPTDDQIGDTKAEADQNLLIGKNNSGQEYKIVNGSGKQDTSYILRWPYTTLAPGNVAKFVSNIGATVKPYAIPTVKKTYKNLTSKDGTNNVGDKLHFTLSVRNDGYGSNWIISKIKDDLPNGLTIDPNSTLINESGTGIDYNPNTGVTDGATATYEFDATINNKAPVYATNGKITNTVQFTGYNKGFSDTRTYEDSVDIPIETPDYAYDFTHQVRNVTADPNSDFSDSVDATTGDQLEIKSVFTASVGIAENAKYTNTALDDNGDGYNNQDDKLSLKSGTVFVNGVLNPDAIQNGLFTKSFTPAGQSNTYIYRVIVNSSTEEIIRNNSTMENVKDVNNKTLSIGPSDTISIRVHPPVPTTSFIEVPELIDFGSINSTGTEKMLTNKQTKGNLIVSHSAETPYQVLVSYDNNSDQALANGDEKLIQDDGLSLLLDNNSNEAVDDWEPLSTTGIPINNQEFIGSDEPLDLTKYVGLDKWKLRVPSTAKSGKYTGQVTWTIADTPVE
jgi:hypothetical protein